MTSTWLKVETLACLPSIYHCTCPLYDFLDAVNFVPRYFFEAAPWDVLS